MLLFLHSKVQLMLNNLMRKDNNIPPIRCYLICLLCCSFKLLTYCRTLCV